MPVIENDPSHRVAPQYKDKLMTGPVLNQSVKTLYDVVNHSFERFESKTCMQKRKFLGMRSVNPAVKHFDENTISYNYKEVGEKIHRFGAALRQEGLVPAPEVATLNAITTPCSLAIFENTCSEWMIGALGAFSQSIIVTTIYATLGLDATVTAIQDGSVSAILCNKKNVKKILSRSSSMHTLKTIIYTNDCIADDDDVDFGVLPAHDIKVIAFDDFVTQGDIVAYPPTPPKPSTVAILMYTSGSTGKPKGVVLTHAQSTACCGAFTERAGFRQSDVFIGYLPLAHIFELMGELSALSVGAAICYADPKTLTARGSYPKGALEQYAPTVIPGVPKVWDLIKKGVEAKIASSEPVPKFLITTAIQWRKFASKYGFDTPLFNALVFKKLSKAVGGRMRIGYSGGGPLNSEVHSFIQTCFGVPFFQGYVSADSHCLNDFNCTLVAYCDSCFE